jgi:hypothetical protein
LRALAAAVPAALLLASAPAPAQVSGLEIRGYYLNVATGSLEGPFTPAGLTDFQRLRLSTSPEIGIFALDVAYEQALHLFTDSELGGFQFASLGTTETRTDWLPLQGTIAEGDHARWTHRVDRLSLQTSIGDRVEISAGREAVSWATTLFLTPADPFAPFDPADPFRDYRVGVDVARVQVYAGTFTELDAVVNPTEVGDETNMTALVRGTTLVGRWALGGWGGIIYDRPGAAISATVTTGGMAFRGEGSVRNEPDETVFRGAIGADRNFRLAGRDLYMALEYQYDGFGAAYGHDLVSTVLSVPYSRGELQVLGQHEAALQAVWQTSPLVSVEWLTMWSLSDGSVLLSPAASLSLSNEITGRAGLFLGFGAETRPAPPIPGAPVSDLPASEYGVVPASLYVSLTAYF